MILEHIAIWTEQLEVLKDFYVDFFQGKAGEKYINPRKQFQSYFIEFEGGARLELMQRPDIEVDQYKFPRQSMGLTHFAFGVENMETVNELTEKLRAASYTIAGEARKTGDGYYESIILDPDGNQVEIACKP